MGTVWSFYDGVWLDVWIGCMDILLEIYAFFKHFLIFGSTFFYIYSGTCGCTDGWGIDGRMDATFIQHTFGSFLLHGGLTALKCVTKDKISKSVHWYLFIDVYQLLISLCFEVSFVLMIGHCLVNSLYNVCI